MSKKFDITTSIFYRWRYWIGYGTIIALLIGLLLVAGFLIPGAVSDSEYRSIINTSSFDPWSDLTNLPFYLLQHVTLAIFGVTLLGIKLPALILGFVTAICMAILLRRWFSPGIAVLASILAIATGQFLFLAQNGATGILYLFWPTVLLLLGTLVANRSKGHGLWKILAFIAAALSLYTPLSIYVLIAIASAVMIHPHLRHIIYRLPRYRIIIGGVIMAALLVPLALSIIQRPRIGLTLLGIPSEWPNLFENVQTLLSQYFSFMSLGNQSILLPVFGFASILLILYGLVRLIKTYATVQSHIILAWTVLLLPVLLINPSFVSIMFVPQLLLLASGFEGVLRRWYRLFPMNPYARVVGLVPLIILVGSMVLFGLERYAYAYRYAPEIVQNFSRDILVIPDTEHLVVSSEEFELYTAVAAYKPDLKIFTPDAITSLGDIYAVTAAAYDSETIPDQIISSGRSQDGVRFYIYK